MRTRDFLPGEAGGGIGAYALGAYRLDSDALELRDGEGRPVDLPPTAFDLLLHLVRNRERVVSKQELVRELWPDVVVNDNALAQCVWAARRAIGDGGRDQRFIKNVRGRGYRFIGPVTEDAGPSPSSRPPSNPPARPLLGRAEELEWIGKALDDARLGRGRICLIGGEAGMGKTRIAEEARGTAAEGGFVVLDGRGYDDEGMPPFWAWKQILRAFSARCDAATLAELAGPEAADLAKLMPDLRRHVASEGEASLRESDDDRYYLFQAVADFLVRASARQPLFLTLDDVHWVDPSSMRLLKFMAPVIGTARIALLAAFRLEELDEAHSKVIASISRRAGVEQRELRGLARDSVAELLDQSSHAASDEVVSRVTTITSGNPLFVQQLAPLLVGRGARAGDLTGVELPSAIRDALGRRVEPVGARARAMLRVASVLGQDFKLSDLRRAMRLETTEVLGVLSELLSHRLFVKAKGGDGVYEFSHPLLREIVHQGLSEAERVLLHRDIARAIEEAYADFPFARLDELAHHYVAAASSGVAAKALHYARLAAKRAFETTAYEEAARQYRSALAMLDLIDARDEADRCELLVGLGHALRGGGADVSQVREVFQEAADRAQAIGRPDLFADAALGFAGGGGALRLGPLTEMGRVDVTELSLLSSAVELLGAEDSERKVLALAWLARSLYHTSETERRMRAADEAVAMARRLGSDPLLGAALYHRQQILRSPHVLGRRIEDLTEVVAIAERSSSRELQLDARLQLGWAYVHAARIEDSENEIRIATRIAAELGQPGSARGLEFWHLAHDYIRGNVDEVIGRDYELSMQRRNTRLNQAFGVRLTMARYMQGRAAETVHLLEQYVEDLPLPVSWKCGLCSTYAVIGRMDEAAALFEELAATGFAGVPMTHDWLSSYMLLSNACHLLEDSRRAPLIRDLLLPFENHVQVMGIDTYILAPVSLPVANMHSLCGDFEQAERSYLRAIELATRLRSPSLTAWVKVEAADMYTRRGRPGDRDRARLLVAEISSDVAATGFAYLTQRGEHVLSKC